MDRSGVGSGMTDIEDLLTIELVFDSRMASGSDNSGPPRAFRGTRPNHSGPPREEGNGTTGQLHGHPAVTGSSPRGPGREQRAHATFRGTRYRREPWRKHASARTTIEATRSAGMP